MNESGSGGLAPTDSAITLVVNGQQIEFVERVRRDHYPALSIEQMVRRALAEWGPALLEQSPGSPVAGK